jgi:segregation and condensation protein A
MSEVRVQTKVYTGPLDLLLYLCRRAEVDIFELPVAEIAEHFVQELEQMPQLDLEHAGEFLVMAATLLKLKSDLVLARGTEQQQAEAERARLVTQLLEYKRIRDMAARLSAMYDRQALRHARPPGQMSGESPESDNNTFLEDISLVDLYRVFHRMYGEIAEPKPHYVDLSDRPVRWYIERILEQLRASGRVDFEALLGAGRGRAEVIGNFLALLEMVKQREVSVEQLEDGRIVVGPPPDDAPEPAGAP